ncbi:hypothetical protein PBCV1_A447aR [Paramecium bursaria Chlorella virus 1]|uniref:Uncharacterized protein n=1 Tax=Paramecium bursaria Chlorella virus 1 TaxID=10506 RepID=F8TU40_PBCV1|nr:hypothetical protein PBCV1_A447aR [Paramecium bursaria Chlorella virus 1]AEI70101.1 hypothetical protein [Paramecium bursaria Chlorella virus 1]
MSIRLYGSLILTDKLNDFISFTWAVELMHAAVLIYHNNFGETIDL